jgi:hypothetical protein
MIMLWRWSPPHLLLLHPLLSSTLLLHLLSLLLQFGLPLRFHLPHLLRPSHRMQLLHQRSSTLLTRDCDRCL